MDAANALAVRKTIKISAHFFRSALTKNFVQQEGGKDVNPRELTVVSDRG